MCEHCRALEESIGSPLFEHVLTLQSPGGVYRIATVCAAAVSQHDPRGVSDSRHPVHPSGGNVPQTAPHWIQPALLPQSWVRFDSMDVVLSQLAQLQHNFYSTLYNKQ